MLVFRRELEGGEFFGLGTPNLIRQVKMLRTLPNKTINFYLKTGLEHDFGVEG